jgi:sphingomyelin phosphodiesterase 2
MVRPNPLINVNAIVEQASLWYLLLSHHGHILLSSVFNFAALYHYLVRCDTYLGNKPCTLDPDLVGFQESFVEEDRNILINELEKGSRLKYHQYYPSRMVGSGLLISSAYPIRETSFHQYEDSNPSYKVWEGDYWAGKGVALARIELPNSNGYVDFFNTHTQAGYGNPEYKIVRERQLIELVKFMNKSRENIAPAFLVGDMNCEPGEDAFELPIKDAHLLRIMKIDSGNDHVFAIKK